VSFDIAVLPLKGGDVFDPIIFPDESLDAFDFCDSMFLIFDDVPITFLKCVIKFN
jgi:hypothetical protein